MNTTMNSRNIDHLLRKCPESFFNNLEELNKRRELASRHLSYKVVRKRNGKTKPPLKHVKGKLFKRFQDTLFLCLKCKGLLEGPVTLECGHTFCRRCLDNFRTGNCFYCATEDEGHRCTNILLNDVLSKWRDMKESHQERGVLIGRVITISDFECILCSQCLLDPVTTSCGHTFCRNCLARVLDHGLSCPLCMAILRTTDLIRNTTRVLLDALRILLPEEYKKRIVSSRSELGILDDGNSHVPVFVCTNAFPSVACPLFVYEPRYRLLTRRCLQSTTKTFAMAVNTRSNSIGNGNGGDGGGGDGVVVTTEKFASYGTILEVRDAVYMPDGTCILSTVGVKRFRVISRSEKDGYDTAEIEYIRDSTIPSDKLSSIVSLHANVREKACLWLQSLNPFVFKEIERSLGPIPDVENDWIRLADGPSWAWWLVPILPLSSQLQLGFLSSTSIEKRLRAIEKLLDHLADRSRRLLTLDTFTVVNCVTTTTTTTPTTATTTTITSGGILTAATNTSNHTCNFNETAPSNDSNPDSSVINIL